MSGLGDSIRLMMIILASLSSSLAVVDSSAEQVTAGGEISLATSIYVSAHSNQDAADPNREKLKQKSNERAVDFDDWPQQGAIGRDQADSSYLSELAAANSLRSEATSNGTSMMLINLPASSSSSSPSSAQNLNSGFLVLFDEITKMKNSSINALIRLQYFDNNSLNKQSNGNYSSENYPRQPNISLIGNSNNQANLMNPLDTDTIRPSIISRTNQNRSPNTNKQRQQEPQLVLTKVLGADSSQTQSLAAKINWQLSYWFENLNRKVGGLFKSLAASLSPTQALIQMRQQQQSTRVVSPAGPKTGRHREKTFDGRDHELSKRHTPALGQEENNRYGSGSQPCIELKQNQLARCRSIELLVSYNLNNSFPGTLQAIEDNCRHISSLLSDCWPQQLQYLRNSLASWNETVLSMTDFPLPAPSPLSSPSSPTSSLYPENLDESNPAMGQRRTRTPSCGAAPQLSDLVMDRINWMWLNLCMDKKFRLDYVENLKCLSLWTQDRAQTVCSNEYKRMQLNLRPSQDRRDSNMMIVMRNPDESPSLGRQPRGVDFVPSINVAAATAASAPAQIQASRALDGLDAREIESKILCCIFDLFLRCVNRQAVRDCGRHGGQFVVNFMSRIGTDDMKYLCNSEPRSASATPMAATTMENIQHQPFSHQNQILAGSASRINQRLGPKRNNAMLDRSPFIQSNYCTDTRIVAVLYGKSFEIYGDKSGPSQMASGNMRPTLNGDHFGNRHTQQSTNYDPNFFDGDAAVESGAYKVAGRPRLHLPVLLLLLLLITNISWFWI